MMGGGLFNTALKGTGYVAILSDGPPVMLDVGSAPTFADAQAAITWSEGVLDVDPDRLQGAQEPDRPRLGRDDPDGVRAAQGWVLVQPTEGRLEGAGRRRRRRRRCSATCSNG